MKKIRQSTILLLVLTLLCSIFILASCGGGCGNNCDDSTPTPTPSTPTKLTAPTVVLTDDTVTWSADVSADKFEISIDGNLSYIENSVTSRKLTDGQTFKIRAIGDGTNYTNSDWSNSVTYAKPIPKYTITWKNGNTVLEIDTEMSKGTVPTYDGAEPTKAADAQYTYTFSGWTPQISPVTGSVTYQAQFTETLRTYTVTFYSEDGLTVLDTVTVEYGSNAVYSKSTPVKNATAGHTYVFEKWVTTQGGSVADDLTNVICDRSVYASFKEFIRTVTVYIVSNNSDYGIVSVSTMNNVPYGATITVKGNTVTINGQSVTANANTATAQYTYTFANWTSDATVGNDTIITANFSRSVNSYTVTWKNGNDTLETDENVAYGSTPVYNGAQPSKESDNENIYTFSGWSPDISSITGDVTYVAQFISTAKKHTVIFYDDDGMTELGRVVVGHGETAIYPNALPTKESTAEITYTFEKWVTAKDGATEASFTNITENKYVYAKYSTTARTYVVTFCDYDGTTISQINVAYGNAATAPGDPEREGYRFDGWDKKFTNITGELTVKATYVQQFTVEFLDYDNSVIDIQLVDYNGNATAPENPTRNNYRFTGWNTNFSNVVHDLTVKAEYIRQYKVTFLDYDETVLKEVTVDAGSTVAAPSNPSKEGYTFEGWDKDLTNVSSDFTVTATYKANTYTVTFRMPDGTIIKEQNVKYGEDAVAPMYSDDFLEGKVIYLDDLAEFPRLYFSDTKTASYFSGWNDSLEEVKENREIYAKYERAYDKPVIFVEQIGNVLKVCMYCPNNCYVYGLEFGFDWDSNGCISNCVEELGTNKDAEYNNNDKTFKYIMFEGAGCTSQSNYFDVTTITYSNLHGFVLDISNINILSNCSIIYASKANADVDELVKITPIIVIK